MKYLLVVLIGIFVGCTDTQKASFGALGESGNIKCYSGGKLVLDATSTGRIATTSNSDGWEFKDAKTGKFVRASCDCIIEN